MLNYKGFKADCVFDNAKGSYLSKVLNCEDVILGQVLSPEQAEDSFRQCIDIYLLTRHHNGLPLLPFKTIR